MGFNLRVIFKSKSSVGSIQLLKNKIAHMANQIFAHAPNWSFSQPDHSADHKFATLLQETRRTLPRQFYDVNLITMFHQIKHTKLYPLLKTLPKGVMHHVHLGCCEDLQFYSKYVVNHPIVYLAADLKSLNVGSKQEAREKGWVTMQEGRKCFQNEEDFLEAVSGISMMTNQEKKFSIQHPEQCWEMFEKKILAFYPIVKTLNFFKNYIDHIFRKFIKNGYTRIEFRSSIYELKEYDQRGNLIKAYDRRKFFQVIDEVYEQVKADYPFFSVGFIFAGLKMLTLDQNEKSFTFILEQEWDKTVGLDFVQEEDPFGSIQKYDQVANRVLEKFPNQKIKKVYHCGETNDHMNNNVELAINAGTARIGHGLNVLQHPYLLQVCREKQICFEKSPISNLVLGYCHDPRKLTAPLLLGLGIPVSINPDDPGKFGYEDATMDYFVSLACSTWTLKHLKLIAIHSINHAVCSEEEKKLILENFTARWDVWVEEFLSS